MNRIHGILTLPFVTFSLLFGGLASAAAERTPATTRDVTPARLASSAGGNDLHFEWSDATRIDVASNGDIYLAYTRIDPGDPHRSIVVERSTDGGDSFQEIQVLSAATTNRNLHGLRVIEGDENRVIILYVDEFPDLVGIAWADLAAATGPWTESVISTGYYPTLSVPVMADDSIAYSGWYLYMAREVEDGGGTDIAFSRSTDFGATWETPYVIADQTQGYNYQYRYPKIAFGEDIVHVGWTYTERLQDEFDDAIYYRACFNYGDSGISDWGPLVEVLADDDGLDSALDQIGASNGGAGRVLMLYRPQYNDPEMYAVPSFDAGATWAAGASIPTGFHRGAVILYRPSDGNFVIGGGSLTRFNPTSWHEPAFRTITPTSPMLSLGAVQVLADSDQKTYGFNPVDMAFDPTHGDQIAMAWDFESGSLFDAQWRTPLPYPVPEAGFPVSISGTPGSSPALADLDGDGTLEILFTTIEGSVYVIEHDGSIRSGWPQSIGASGHGAPVAVGDLNGDGQMEILAANATGTVYSFAPDGSVNPYWPVDLGTNAPAYLCIGAIGPVYPRHAVVASDDRLFALSYRGEDRGPGWILPGPVHQPPSVGDIDNDGVSEIVVVQGPWILGAQLGSPSIDVIRELFGKEISGPAALADFDQDGDLEIVVPTAQGDVYVVHHTGGDLNGWPWSNPAGGAVCPVAVAQNLGTTPPDVSFVQANDGAHLVTDAGIEQASYPVDVPGSVQGIIVERVNRSSSNLIGTGDAAMTWSVENTGGIPPAWPIPTGIGAVTAPAAGDLDLDGRIEIVIVNQSEVRVLEVSESPDTPGRHWPMYGYDAQRSSCLNCTEDVVTAVGPSMQPARNSLSAPWPNPGASQIRLRYGLAEDSRITLAIYDLRGRRVREILQERRSAGDHVLTFDGRDQDGHPLAAGVYLLQLRIIDGNGEQPLSRKFTWVR